MKRINPFDEIYKKCNNGANVDKFKTLSTFPKYIDLELTNFCNFKCLMCPTGTGSIKRNQGFMDKTIYYKIIEEVKNKNIGIRFIRWGEPTLHTEFYNFLKIAKENNIFCHFNTNGFLLNDKEMQILIDLKVDSIKFSFQGIDRQSYLEMRNKDYFDELIKKIKLLSLMRNEKLYPYIQISTTVTYETDEQVKVFKEMIFPYVDYISVGKTKLIHIDPDKIKLSPKERIALKVLKEKETLIKKHHSCCPEIYDKLSVNWDGTVSACCSDYDNFMVIGNLQHETLEEIWNNKKMNFYRKLLTENNYDAIPLCKNCFDYIPLTKN